MPRLNTVDSFALGSRNYDQVMKDKALVNDIIFSITPATVTPAPISTAWTRTVVIKLVDASGNTHKWVSGAWTTTLTIADESDAGTATIVTRTLTLVDGVANIVVSGDAEDWLDSETDTLTVGNITVAGISVTGGTSVETFTTA